ncbi:RlmE family RNA methyltransferase [Salinisphaera sp. LB1]|uniref:RlmE family RNA methyltransferase n=1 Tax=Salinisphaera sp. LB1 TaxID=2183911 RepID=UPI000D7053AC|nr:RlmE family RNA methyltransferase [Salinisphaera sp. LB1]AWN17605.1 Heat shock protein FtsJ/RrmJ, Ribosomal RNA large subunit methyltransferase E [Salinisphaera sp. LB1]
MSKRSDTKRWLAAHRADPYVKAAQSDHYRSRAAYKLAEIDDKDRLLARARCVVDLGAAPGGWSQYVRRRKPEARVIALDRLPMDGIDGVRFLQVDFAEQAGLDALMSELDGAGVDLVLSDMAPNLTGVKAADQAGVMQLAELSLALCDDVLRPGGALLIKVFQGEGFDELLANMRKRFARVMTRKPKASRDASREMYLLGTGWQGG